MKKFVAGVFILMLSVGSAYAQTVTGSSQTEPTKSSAKKSSKKGHKSSKKGHKGGQKGKKTSGTTTTAPPK